MPQEFLASFGVDIDESGVNDLQRILTENRGLAASLSAAFRSASASIDDFITKATESLPSLPFLKNGLFTPGMTSSEDSGFVFSLDFSKATRDLTAFMKSAQKQLRLTADASGVIAAANSALASIQSSFASTKLKLNVDFNLLNSGGDQNTRNGQATVIDLRSLTNITPAATGGRFSEPTNLEVAEDGDPEYVIPVRKEALAIPLLQRLFADLSDSARDSLRQSLAEGSSTGKAEIGSGSSVAASSSSAASYGGLSEEGASTGTSKSTPLQSVFENNAPVPAGTLKADQVTFEISGAFSDAKGSDIPSAMDSSFSESTVRQKSTFISDGGTFFIPSDLISSLLSVLRPSSDQDDSSASSHADQSVLSDLIENGFPSSFLSSITDHLTNGEDVSTVIQSQLSSITDLISTETASALSLDQIADALVSLPSQLSVASSAASMNVSQVSHNSVDAPISIQVTAPSASPEEVGRSVYDVAERYLIRTLESVF